MMTCAPCTGTPPLLTVTENSVANWVLVSALCTVLLEVMTASTRRVWLPTPGSPPPAVLSPQAATAPASKAKPTTSTPRRDTAKLSMKNPLCR